MSSLLNLETYSTEELEQIIPALGTFIKPILYNGRYIASCSHYTGACSYCPVTYNIILCDTISTAAVEDIDSSIESRNKFFPDSFINNHPEYLI